MTFRRTPRADAQAHVLLKKRLLEWAHRLLRMINSLFITKHIACKPKLMNNNILFTQLISMDKPLIRQNARGILQVNDMTHNQIPPGESMTAVSLCPAASEHRGTERPLRISPRHLPLPPGQCD